MTCPYPYPRFRIETVMHLPHLRRLKHGDRFHFHPYGRVYDHPGPVMTIQWFYWGNEEGGCVANQWIVAWEDGTLYPGMNSYTNVCKMIDDGELVPLV